MKKENRLFFKSPNTNISAIFRFGDFHVSERFGKNNLGCLVFPQPQLLLSVFHIFVGVLVRVVRGLVVYYESEKAGLVR